MLPSSEEKTEVVYGAEKIFERNPQSISDLKESLDGCFDRSGPSMLTLGIIKDLFLQLEKRGIRPRLVTEMTNENISHCKELIKIGHKVRHLDGAVGNFAIGDGREIRMFAILKEGIPPEQILISNVRSFVEQRNTYLMNYGKRQFLQKRE